MSDQKSDLAENRPTPAPAQRQFAEGEKVLGLWATFGLFGILVIAVAGIVGGGFWLFQSFGFWGVAVEIFVLIVGLFGAGRWLLNF